MLLIRNLTKKKFNEIFLLKAEKSCLEESGIKNKTEISLVICGEKKIKNLNRLYRKKDKTTDVLSFGDQKSDFIAAPDGTLQLGEIFICYPVAERQAQKAGHSLEKEMAILLVHGILHLAGYNHERSKTEKEKMFELQEKIMTKIFRK